MWWARLDIVQEPEPRAYIHHAYIKKYILSKRLMTLKANQVALQINNKN